MFVGFMGMVEVGKYLFWNYMKDCDYSTERATCSDVTLFKNPSNGLLLGKIIPARDGQHAYFLVYRGRFSEYFDCVEQ